MSITDELRECIATAIWQYENDTKTAYIPKDKLTAIADRIDEQHRRALERVAAMVDEPSLDALERRVSAIERKLNHKGGAE